MALEQDPNTTPSAAAEQEIDLIELIRKVWSARGFILKVCGIAAVVGLIVGFSIPKEYLTQVTLAPETTSKTGSGMGALAAMAGINLATTTGEDALSPEIYPDIVRSTPFLLELFPVEVTTRANEIQTTLADYLENYQKSPWWTAIFQAPFKVLGWGLSLFREEPEEREGGPDPFRLTLEESRIVENMAQRIAVSVDKKTGITTLSVLMQDPLVSATLTDTVMKNLQNYITTYRTNKARQDLTFTETLYREAQENYHTAQQKYAEYSDGNMNVILHSYRIEQERLQNEMNLAYNIYNQVAQQLQMAKAKVQEITPVYTVVQPATVPLRQSKPSKILILIGFVFLAGVGSTAWVLFGRELLKNFK